MAVLTTEEIASKEKNEKFLTLVRQNPTLPIVPLVDYEIVCEDCGRWLGSIGECYVGEYAIYGDRYYTDREEFKENYYDKNDEELDEKFNYNPWISIKCQSGKFTKEQVDTNRENYKKLEAFLEEKANEHFVKAIILNIDLP